MATEVGMFPVGCRVRPTEYAYREYGGRFTAGRWMDMRGTVIEGTSPGSIHVDWGGEFRGHSRNEGTHYGHCWYVDERMIVRVDEGVETVVESAIPSVSAVPAAIPRLRVSISRNMDGYGTPWILTVENGPVPSKTEIMAVMETGMRKRIPSRIWNNYDLDNIIHLGIDTYGVDPQAFIDAVTEASLAKQAREATGVFERSVYDHELQQAIGNGPAIIAIGDQLFSLHPRGVVKTGRAMATIREKIVKVAKDNAARIVAAAKAEAEGLISNGERQLRETRIKLERELAASRTQLTLPQWVADNYVKVRRWDSPTFKMAVGIEVNTQVMAWQLVHTKVDGNGHHSQETVRWEGDAAPALSRCHTVTVWMPFDDKTGIYAYKSAKILDNTGDGNLPHLTSARCCMELQGLPEKIDSIDSYKLISAAINRGNQEVNMMSLLSRYDQWHRDIQDQCPKGLKKLIDHDMWMGHNIDSQYFTGATVTAVEDEARGVFNVETLRSRRMAAGIELPEVALVGDVIDGLTDAVDNEVEEDEEHQLIVDEDVDRDR